MKGLIIAILITFGVSSCIAPPLTTGTTNQGSSSSEMEARRLTTQMKNSLALKASQEEKVLVINVVNLSLIKKLRESNQTDQIPKTQAKYKSKMKEVLNSDQYSKFLTEFGNI
jgi:DNA recombination-dependent growth factor C